MKKQCKEKKTKNFGRNMMQEAGSEIPSGVANSTVGGSSKVMIRKQKDKK